MHHPSPSRLIEQVRWCEVYFQNNISLRTAWPLLFIRRPWIITHQGFIEHTDGQLGLNSRVQSFVLRFATCISISRAIAGHQKAPSTIIPNPYDDGTFRILPEISRDRELVFLGRLVPEKGRTLLLDALVRLRKRGLRPGLTFIGSGTQESALRQLTDKMGLSDQVEFVGVRRGDALTRLLNRHRILVVPSAWQEPFGGREHRLRLRSSGLRKRRPQGCHRSVRTHVPQRRRGGPGPLGHSHSEK